MLVLTPDFPPENGGIQLLMHRLVCNLEGAQAKVITLGTAGDKGFDDRSGLDVTRVARSRGPLHRLAIARLNAAALRATVRDRPRVVVSGHAVTAPAAAVIGATSSAVVAQYVYGKEFGTRPRLVRFALRQADLAVAISSHTKRLALAAGADPDRLAVIPPGVDLPWPAPRNRAGHPIVLTVARLADPHKGHDEMMRALPLIRARVPGVEWVVIGEGPLRSELEQLAEAQGVADAVRFLGAVSDEERDEWFDRAHVFAMPSRLPPSGVGGEGFGIVFLEAAAHGLPVVAGAVGGAIDAVEDGRAGLLVDPTDPLAIAAAVTDLLLDPDRAAALGSAGARRAQELTWRRHARALQRLIAEVPSKPNRRR